jgi:hypothetical protein
VDILQDRAKMGIVHHSGGAPSPSTGGAATNSVAPTFYLFVSPLGPLKSRLTLPLRLDGIPHSLPCSAHRTLADSPSSLCDKLV